MRFVIILSAFSVAVFSTFLTPIPALALDVGPRPFVSETVSSGAFVNTSVDLDSRGHPHIACWDVNNQSLKYYYRSGGSWQEETIFANAFVGGEVVLKVDADDVPHVVFQAYNGGDQIRYSNRIGGTWLASELVSPNAVAPGMDIDGSGRVHVSYRDTAAGFLVYALRDGVWVTDPILVGATRNTALVVDAVGHPHVAYYQGGFPGYATKSGSTWWTESIPMNFIQDVTDMDIAVNAQGMPTIVVYFEDVFTGHSLLYLPRQTDGSWPVESLDSQGNVGEYCEIEIDQDGRYHFAAYADIGVGGDPRYYAVLDTCKFGPQPVDQSGDKGRYLSMALDPHGNPAISYINSDSGDLLYAMSGLGLLDDPTGMTWPVGGERSVTWRGAGEVDILLSTNGGASYQTLASHQTGGSAEDGGKFVFVVPHQPSRFCKLRVERASPYAVAESDSFFTIETSIDLLNFTISLDDLEGNNLSWTSDPGPADLGGYRLEKRSGSAWRTLVETTETFYHDAAGGADDRYRLYASNRLGQEFFLGESSPAGVPSAGFALRAWPVPYSSGVLNVSYATGGPGGAAAASELAVFDVAGRRIATLEHGQFGSGLRSVKWDGRTDDGRAVASGIYFVRATSGANHETLKITIIR